MAGDPRRRPRRHVHRARGDRRPRGRHGDPRPLAGHEPRRRHDRRGRSTTRRSSRPGKMAAERMGGLLATGDAARCERAVRRTWRDALPRGLARRGPGSRDAQRTSQAALDAAEAGDADAAAELADALRRDAAVRHRRAARQARRGPQPDEPRRGRRAGRGRPRRVPARRRRQAGTPGRRSATTPGTTPTCSPATPPRSSPAPGFRAMVLPAPAAHAGARLRGPPPRRRRRRRWSPPATTRRRTTATRSTSATARRSSRRPTPRSPPASRPSAPLADDPAQRRATRTLDEGVVDGYLARVCGLALPGGARDDLAWPTPPCTASAAR